MAPATSHRPIRADLDMKNTQHSQQRSRRDGSNGAKALKLRKEAPSQKSTPAATNHPIEISSDEEQSTDEEEDSDVDDDLNDDEDDEPEVIAPSHGVSLGSNKGRTDRHLHDQGNAQEKELHARGTGLHNGSLLGPPFTPSKKRRFSNMSTNSILDTSNEEEGLSPRSFPRKKKHRALSNDSNGLLTYTALRQSVEALDIPLVAVESSDDDDDDSIYQAVNLISDDEEDEPDVEKVEEEIIMSTEPIPTHDFVFNGQTYDVFDDIPVALFSTPDRHLNPYSDIINGVAECVPRNGQGVEARKYSSGSTKRVRFWDEQSAGGDSSSTSSDLDAMFPDIFAEQDNLPPILQQLIENDTDGEIGNLTGSDGDNSYWDFSENDQNSPSQRFIEEDGDDDEGRGSDVTSSGYDSDEGETTDEECPPPTTIRAANTLLHRSSSSDSDKATRPRKPFKRNARKSAKNGPRWGLFSVDPRKATAFTDQTGSRVIVHPPQIAGEHSKYFPTSSTSSTADNSPRAFLMATPGDESDFMELTPQNVTNPRDIMFGGIFGMPQDVGNLLKGHVIGPPEAFFPFVSVDSNGNRIDEEEEYFDDDDHTDGDIDLESFLALPEMVDENNLDMSNILADSDVTTGHSDCPDSTPIARTRSVGETMMEHFDRAPGVVSSFRSNQDKYRKIASQHPNPELQASNSQAVRFGKSAETPITPLRKRGAFSRRSVSQAESPLLRHSARHPGPRMGTFS